MAKLPRGIAAAALAALLFGLSTPFAKLLLAEMPPVLLAGLLYLGSGLGLTALRSAWRLQGADAAALATADVPWLAGAVLFGGVLGPVLLMVGLRTTPASATALLLNLEGVFTALLAWFVFRENVDGRIALSSHNGTTGSNRESVDYARDRLTVAQSYKRKEPADEGYPTPGSGC